MEVVTCKMCGEGFGVAEGVSVAKCINCGTMQSIPNTDKRKLLTLYNQANILRYDGDFDDAYNAYEDITEHFENQAEAYWGMLLSEYGVQYKADSSNGKMKPVIHRTSFRSILMNEIFKEVKAAASAETYALYKAEAASLEEQRIRNIKAMLDQPAYDIYVSGGAAHECRTEDNANLTADIVAMLKREGYRVFYAPERLDFESLTEDVVFSALRSSKIMIVVGSEREQFEILRVKEEWTRFLQMIEDGHSQKVLLPVYSAIVESDLPKVLKKLRSMDMDKDGSLSILLKVVRKIGTPAELAGEKELIKLSLHESMKVNGFVKDAFIALKKSEFSEANQFCDSALDLNPECAEAYLAKMMSKRKITSMDALAKEKSFEDDLNFRLAKYLGNEKYEALLNRTAEEARKNAELERKTEIYDKAAALLSKGQSSSDFRKAASLFSEITGFKDVDKQIEQCNLKAEDCRKDEILHGAERAIETDDYAGMKRAVELLSDIDEWKNAAECKAKCRQRMSDLLDGVPEAIRVLNCYSKHKKYSEMNDTLEKTKNDIRNVCTEQNALRQQMQDLNIEGVKAEQETCTARTSVIEKNLIDITAEKNELEKEKVELGFLAIKRKREIIQEQEALDVKTADLEQERAGISKRMKTLDEICSKYESLTEQGTAVSRSINEMENTADYLEKQMALFSVSEIVTEETMHKAVDLLNKTGKLGEVEPEVLKNVSVTSLDLMSEEVFEKLPFELQVEFFKAKGTITFGQYPQDSENAGDASPLEWVILGWNKEERYVLLVTDEIIDSKGYHHEDRPVSWSQCSIRNWLNTEFLNTVFSEEEKQKILTVKHGGHNLTEQVFLLDPVEVESCLSNVNSREVSGTIYAESRGLNVYHGTSNWWLRPQDSESPEIIYVSMGGVVQKNYRMSASNGSVGVRPAVWLRV